MKDEGGWDGDADFARVEVGRVRDEYGVVGNCDGYLVSISC